MGIGYIPKRDADGNRVQNVITVLEQDNKSLALASAEGDFVDDTCELVVKIPGAVGSVGRYIKEGYAFCDQYAWGIRLERAALVDKDFVYAGMAGFYPATPTEAGIPGVEGLSWAQVQPDGVELGDYCDTEVAAVNKGWRLWCDEGNQGGCDIDNMAGYGNLYGQAYLVLYFTKPAAATTTTKMAANLQWGSKK
jgi:hypothetical protein